MKKRLICLVTAVVSAALLTLGLTACGPKADDETLHIYHGYFQTESEWPTAARMREIYQKFADDHKDIKIEFHALKTGADGVRDKVNAEVADGAFPDVVDFAGGGVMAAAVEANLVMDLKPIIDADATLKKQVGINYDQNQVGGKIYTVHDQTELQGIWYNEKVFTEAKKTQPNVKLPTEWTSWADFTATTALLRTAGYKPYLLDNSAFQRLAGAWIGSTEAGRAAINGQKLTAAQVDAMSETLKTIGAELKANKDFALTNDNYRDYFFKGEGTGHTMTTAMCFNGVWDAGSVTDSPFKDSIKYAAYPGGVAYKSAGNGIAISAALTGKKKDTAIAFMKYMMSDEVQTKIVTQAAAAPCSQNIDLAAIASDANASVSTKMLASACDVVNNAAHSIYSINTAWGGDIADGLSNGMIACASDSADVNAIVASTIADIKALLV